MKKVLIFTYYWPPAGGPGVQRFLKFSKYLGEFGIEPIIVTVNDGAYPYLDESLIKDIPKDLKVYKTNTYEPFRLYNLIRGKKGKFSSVGMIGVRDSSSIFHKFSKFIRANFFIPDARKGWKKYAVKKAVEIISKEKIDAIITTGPPHSTHLIGLQLKQTLNTSWIADMRDPWPNILNIKDLPRTIIAKKQDERLKDKVLKSADYITTVSHGLKNHIIVKNENIQVIHNGYDEEDIFKGEPGKSENFFLSYIGNFKPDQNVPVLWQTLKSLSEELPGFKEFFKLNFTGILENTILQDIRSFGLGNMVLVEEFVPHIEATKKMHLSSMLLFVIPQSDNNKLITTGKLFEYMASRTPMLSIGPVAGDAAKLINEAGRDKMVDYYDKDAIKNLILKYYQKWLDDDKSLCKFPEGDLRELTRKKQTEKLSKIIFSIL